MSSEAWRIEKLHKTRTCSSTMASKVKHYSAGLSLQVEVSVLC